MKEAICCKLSSPYEQEGNGGKNCNKPQAKEPRGGARWNCPACGRQQLYTDCSGRLLSMLSECKTFKSISPADTGKLVETVVGYTSLMHHTDGCIFTRPSGTASRQCGKEHHKSLHPAGKEYCCAHSNAKEPTECQPLISVFIKWYRTPAGGTCGSSYFPLHVFFPTFCGAAPARG